MISAPRTEKHKHCKSNCVTHNSFAVSLRKYTSPSLQTTKYTSNNSKSHYLSKEISQSNIKPFRATVEIQQNKSKPQKELEQKNKTTSKNQIQSYLWKVSLLRKQQTKLSNSSKNLPNYNKIQKNIQKQKQKSQQMQRQKQIQVQTSKQKQSLKSQKIKIKQQESIVTVTSKQFDQLQFNVDRISKIIQCFNIKKSQNKNLIQNSPILQHKRQDEATLVETQNQKAMPNNNEIPNNNEMQKIIKKNLSKYNQNLDYEINSKNISSQSSHRFPLAHSDNKKEKKYSLINKQNVEQIEEQKAQRTKLQSRNLNYKMFNWQSKASLLTNLSVSRRAKCHGGPHI